MKVAFSSIDINNDKVAFTSDGYYDDNTLVFDDLSVENTKIYVTVVNNNALAVLRDGNVNMDVYLEAGKVTSGVYDGNGLSFNFSIFTKHIFISSKEITADYVMSMDNNIVGHNKITIKLL